MQKAAAVTLKGKDSRIHSIAGLLQERQFTGEFEATGSRYRFSYDPLKGTVAGQRLILQGNLTVTDQRGTERVRERVQALVASIQGGLGAGPVRPVVPGASAAASQPASVTQTESTGPLSFTGVMYMQFEPIEARALGVRGDMTRCQLNARLAPTDSAARALHGTFSAIVDALYGEKPDEPKARLYVAELNRLLAL
jgi:hypothetical protein